MPPEFVEYANKLIEEVSYDHPDLDLLANGNVLETLWEGTRSSVYGETDEKLAFVRFKLSSKMVYQKLDRRLDE